MLLHPRRTGPGLIQEETDQFTPLQLALQRFGLVMNLWCKLDLEKRVTTTEM